MAEGFDKDKATTDLKQLLNMGGQGAEGSGKQGIEGRKKKKAKRSKPPDGEKVVQSREVSSVPSGHTDSNGNALLASTTGSVPKVESNQQSQRTQSAKKKEKDKGVSAEKSTETKSPSSAASQKKNPEPKESDSVSIKKRSGSAGGKKAGNVPAEGKGANNSANSNKSTEAPSKSGGSEAQKGTSAAGSSRDVKSAGRANTPKKDGGSDNRGNRAGTDGKTNSMNNNKPRQSKLGEEDLSPEFQQKLDENKMHVLKKKNQRFPKAKFFCRLCDYHLDFKEDCDKHIKDNRHCRRKEINDMDAILRSMPNPTARQLEAITEAVDKVYEEHGIDEWEQKARADIVARLERTLREHIPDVIMFMYGSSLTGFGLKTADINVDLTSSDKDKKLTFLLREVFLCLKDRTDIEFNNVRSDFSAKVPALLLTDEATGLTVCVTIHCYNAHCSSELLAIYSDFDVRVRKLAVTFRYWAHLCGLDRQCDGFIPPQALNLMVVYFLQNIKPQVVPIIQPPKVSGDEVGDFRKDAPAFERMRAKVMKQRSAEGRKTNDVSVGELWLKLIKFYSLEFDTPNIVVSIRSSQDMPRHVKPWNSKKLAVEDPYMPKKNITRMVNNSRIYEYWQDSIRKALHYFGLPRNEEGQSHISEEQLKMYLQLNEKSETFKPGENKKMLDKDKKIASVAGSKVKEKERTDSEKSTEDEKDDGSVVIPPNPLVSGQMLGKKQISGEKDKDATSSYSESEESRDSDREVAGISKKFKQLSLDDSSMVLNQSSASSGTAGQSKGESSFSSTTIVAGSTSVLAPQTPSHQSSLSYPSIPLNGTDSMLQSSDPNTCQSPSCDIDNKDSSGITNDKSMSSFAQNYAHSIVMKAMDQVQLIKADVSSSTSGATPDKDRSVSPNAKKLSHAATPSQSKASSVQGVVSLSTQPKQASSASNTDAQNQASTTRLEDSGVASDLSARQTSISVPETCDESADSTESGQSKNQQKSMRDNLSAQAVQDAASAENDGKDSAEKSDILLKVVAQKDCHYDFTKGHLTDGKGPTLVCTYCEKEGHLKNACPEDELPEVLPLPKPTSFHLKVLSETLSKVPSDVGLNEESFRERQHFLWALEEYIRRQFLDAQLALFGSSCNGFGFDKSDMDICMTFAQRKANDKGLDKGWVIETLARRLKMNQELTNVQAIPTAKVPIVKFTVRESNLEGDISLYNTLAQQNTALLYCYSQIDPRVRILGYSIKTFAKVCDIGDASRGSLSSYAYILMMLYYLQQVEPPVIPVLQELYDGKEKPKHMIEGCDAWFMEDLSRLDKLWPDKGKNKMSVAELWIGFLRFYVEEFNYKEYVVSIRQKDLLTRFEKLWNGTCIAVEDPFDLSHNLGSGLTRKMNNFIFKTFINGRMLYGSPIDENMDMFNSYQCPSDYFFDTDLLSENRPPNVRGCRRCGKIGHLVRHCPAARKERDDEQKKMQQQQQPQQKPNPQQQQRQPPHFQQQRPSPQQQQQQHLQQRPPQHKQGQQMHQQQQKEHEMRERDRREKEQRMNGPAGNMNRNSSAPTGPGLHYNLTTEPPPVISPNAVLVQLANQLLANPPPTNPAVFTNHPSLQAVTPAQLRNMHHSQVFHNTGYYRPQNYQQQQQQHSQRLLMQNGPRFHPPPLMSSTPRPNIGGISLSGPPPPGYNMMPPHYNGSHHPQPGNNNNNHPRPRLPPPGSGYSGPPSGNANTQGMTPVVQNLFASARGQILDAGASQPHRRK